MRSTATQLQTQFPGLGAIIGPAAPSLFEALFSRATTLHKVIGAGLFAFVTAGLANLHFYLPDNPVPISLLTAGALLAGGVMGWKWGSASTMLFYGMGLAGAPFFANGNGGWDYAMHGVTGGYLLGAIVSSASAGYLAQRGWNRGRSLWATLIGGLLIYVPGLLWLTVFDLGWPAPGALFSSGMYPFIPGDLVKIVVVAIGLGALWRAADSRSANRSA